MKLSTRVGYNGRMKAIIPSVFLVTAACAPCDFARNADWSGSDPAPIAGEWRQFRGSADHAGVAPEGTTVGPDMTLVWKSVPLAIGTYSASKTSPTVDDVAVYVGVDDGRLVALDKETGDEIWGFKTHTFEAERDRPDEDNRGIHGTAAVDDTTVYIGDYLGWLYAVDKVSGELVWEEDLGGSIGASPALHRGHLFVSVEYPTPNGKAWVVDADTGKTVFESCFMGDHPHSSSTVDAARGALYVGANNGKFFAFDYVNGGHLWEARMDMGNDGDIKSTAAVVDDTVYITAWDHKLHAFDADTGERRWKFESGERSMSSPSVHDGVVYFGSHDDHLYAVDAASGEEIWRYKTGSSIISSPTVVPATGVVIVGSGDHKVHMVDITTGEAVWTERLDGGLTGVPTATGESLYLFDTTGTTWRFDVE